MQWLTDAGLGLDYGALRLDRTNQRWIGAGARLSANVADQLAGMVAGVEPIGSSCVLELLAKPIVDLAVGLGPEHELADVNEALVARGWIYRGDAGKHGGHVFVLESRPWHRVAHLHVVEFNGDEWRNYLTLRDLLRSSSEARARYESVKATLVEHVGNDRKAYTDGKSDIVRALLNA
jgi:GrpB-like predicted nucleotidyltransferase (UPF0157 family)